MSTTAASAAPETVFDDDSAGVARAYADALLGAAEKEGLAESVLDELDAIMADVLRANPRFAALLDSPSLSEAERDRILIDVFGSRAQPTVLRFLRVLNRHGRLNLLGAVARTARAEWDRRQNRVPVRVRVAAPLDDGQQARLRERLGLMLGGATPILHVTVDPSLIGGLVIQVGDNLYDVSVRSRLEQLRHRLIEGRTHEIQSRRDHFSHPA